MAASNLRPIWVHIPFQFWGNWCIAFPAFPCTLMLTLDYRFHLQTITIIQKAYYTRTINKIGRFWLLPISNPALHFREIPRLKQLPLFLGCFFRLLPNKFRLSTHQNTRQLPFSNSSAIWSHRAVSFASNHCSTWGAQKQTISRKIWCKHFGICRRCNEGTTGLKQRKCSKIMEALNGL